MAHKKAPGKKRQTTIKFLPTQESSRQKRNRTVIADSDSEEATPSRLSKRKGPKEPPAKRRRTDRLSSEEVIVISSKSSSSDDEESDTQIVVVQSRLSTERSEPDGESDSSIILRQPGKKRGRNNRRTFIVSDDEDQRLRSRKGRKQKKSNNQSDNSDEHEPDEDEPPTKRVHRRKTLRKQSLDTTSEEESGDGDNGSDSYDEQEELQEELDFLKSSPPPDRGRLRSLQPKPKTNREKALEMLKKRRGVTVEPSSSATPSRRKPLVIDSDSDVELDVIQEESEDEVSKEQESMGSEGEPDDEEGYNTDPYAVFVENAEDEEFIDDKDALIGEPADLPPIPLQFTRLSNAKPRELFKYAVEWMVHKKLNPAFPANEEIYKLAFRKLDDEVKGLASSKFHSSVWTPEFSRAIRSRPELTMNEIGKGLVDVVEQHCEACNRKSHTASWEASLTGPLYHKDNLEPLDDSRSSSVSDSDSSLDSDGEKPAYDALGERIPPESRVFALGSTCQRNAQTAHTLYHWRYHLYSWVTGYLEREKYCTSKMLLKLDKMTAQKRTKYTNKVVNKMKKEGEIDTLYRLYKDQTETALTTNNDHWRGGRSGRGD